MYIVFVQVISPQLSLTVTNQQGFCYGVTRRHSGGESFLPQFISVGSCARYIKGKLVIHVVFTSTKEAMYSAQLVRLSEPLSVCQED